MLKSDIIESIGTEIERKIGGEWRHEVCIQGMSSEHLDVEIDGIEYVITINEVKDGHHFTEYVGKRSEVAHV